jgi:DNA invertase Pin-like site-specific DNA recombinase
VLSPQEWQENKGLSMRVALYLRRSTTERLQADSLKVQEQILRRYAKEHGMTVVDVFRDSASGTSVKHRLDFMRMAERITKGANFEAVLVRDVSRFGRFMDPDESAYWSFLFETHHVNTIYCEEVFGGDTTPFAGLTKAIRRVMAAEYSRDRSRMIRYSHARVTRLGFLRGGPAPYGMRRVMVTNAGTFVQDLQPGDWKALATNRVKLALGEPKKVEVVRRIFELFSSGAGASAIAAALNADGIPSAKGKKWHSTMIGNMLRNPAYAGRAVLRRKPSAKRRSQFSPLAEPIEVPGSYPEIIDEQTWQQVQERLRDNRDGYSDESLVTNLRRAFERTGWLDQRMVRDSPELCSGQTYQQRFHGGATSALLRAYEKEIRTIRDDLRSALAVSFDVADAEGGFLLNGIARLRVMFAFPCRGSRGPSWPFRLVDADEDDLVLGIGLTAPPVGVGSLFFFSRRRRPCIRAVSPSMAGGKLYHRHRVTDETLRVRLFASLCAGTTAEEQFLSAARSMSMVNLKEIAKELGWAYAAVRRMYHKLSHRGMAMPPIKYKKGRRLVIVCTRCGTKRVARPNRATALRSSLCFRCSCTRPTQKIVIRCPLCGKESQRWPSAINALSSGAKTLCRSCTHSKAGRALIRPLRTP